MAHIDDDPALVHLREYVLARIRGSVLSWQDLVNGEAVDKLLKVIPRDLRAVAKGLAKQGGAGLLQLGGALLAQFGQKLAEKK